MNLKRIIPFFAAGFCWMWSTSGHADPFSGLIEKPRGCVEGLSFPCAVRAKADGQKIHYKNLDIHLNAGGSMIFQQAHQWRLLEGKAWVRTHEVKVEVGTGFVTARFEGDVWLERIVASKSSAEMLQVRNLHGELEMVSPLTSLQEKIPVGFEKWYSLVNSNGELEQGVVKAIEASVFLPTWNKISQLPKAQATKQVKEYKELWMGNVEKTSQVYKEAVSRQMASIEESAELKARKQRAQEQEKEKLREMYRRRFEGDL